MPPKPPKPAQPAPAKPARAPRIAFPKKNQPPDAEAFTARLPLALGKRFEAVRTYLVKQAGVTEDVFYYGPRSGWALRYLQEARPLCALLVHDDQPVAIIGMPEAASGKIDWKTLSPIAQKAKRNAQGSPSHLWLNVPLGETGATDVKTLIKAKLSPTTKPTTPTTTPGRSR